MLSYWFEKSLADHIDIDSYIAHRFFLQLPAVLEVVRAEKGFKRVARQFTEQAETRPWYPLIREYLTEEKKKGLFGRLLG
ncbi:MAG: hypothetical protein H0T73_14990 [Ardenticatenales bacterium]|nr:hypothetical protein [Ardenticatenales bacterium]